MRKWIAFLLCCLLLCGCVAQPDQEYTLPAKQPVIEQETVPTVCETVPEELPDPTEGLHSGLKSDGSFNEGTLFVGDSLTLGLVERYLTNSGHLGQARYIAIPGAPITAYMEGPALGYCISGYTPEFYGLRMFEAVEQAGADVTALYFMMGTNFIERATDQTYIDIVSHMLESCPNATVYLQLVPNSLSGKVGTEFANDRVRKAYACFEGNNRVRLIDTQTAIDFLLGGDGIHLTEQGQERWYQAIVAYARETGIKQ